jgi:hypothetical protein
VRRGHPSPDPAVRRGGLGRGAQPVPWITDPSGVWNSFGCPSVIGCFAARASSTSIPQPDFSLIVSMSGKNGDQPNEVAGRIAGVQADDLQPKSARQSQTQRAISSATLLAVRLSAGPGILLPPSTCRLAENAAAKNARPQLRPPRSRGQRRSKPSRWRRGRPTLLPARKDSADETPAER